MYYNRKLYFPDPSITSGGSDEDSDSGGYEESSVNGNGTITENGNDITTEIGRINELKQIRGYSKDAKIIRNFSINNFSLVRNFLNPNGDRRNILISGDVGATFTLTIKDSSGCNIFKKKYKNSHFLYFFLKSDVVFNADFVDLDFDLVEAIFLDVFLIVAFVFIFSFSTLVIFFSISSIFNLLFFRSFL